MEDALDSEVAAELPPQDPVWALHARDWQYVKPPLRPCLYDIALYERLVFDLAPKRQMLRVLLLGCTPELLLMKWPLDTRIVCIERSQAMAEKVYGPVQMFVADSVHTRLQLGGWFQLEKYFEEESFDLVIGDGCYTQLQAIDYKHLGAQIARVMKNDAVFIHRFFVVPPHPDSQEMVLDGLRKPYLYESFSAFKLRLLTSMQPSFSEGVCLGDVYEAWWKYCTKSLASDIKPQHYLPRERDTMENYRNSRKHYTFPLDTRDALAAAVEPLELATRHALSYEMAEYVCIATMYKSRKL